MGFFNLLKKVYDLLNSKEKSKSIILTFFVLVGIFLESLGVVLILPISSLLIGAEIPDQFKFFEIFLKDIEFSDNLLIVGMVIVVIVYVIKNLYLLLLHYYKIKFEQQISLRLSNDLFKKYINSNYSFYLNSNTSILTRNLLEAGSFESIFDRIIVLITELIITITFLVIFLIIDFETTLYITLTFVIFGGLYILFLKDKIPSWGQVRFEMTGKYLKTINQGLNGIKEIIFSNGQNFFLEKANEIKKKFLNTILKIAVVEFTPRILIEILIISSVAITVLNLSLSGESYEYIVPLLAIYVAAAFRLAPACNKIINHVQGIKFTHAAISILHNQFSSIKKNDSEKVNLKKQNKFDFKKNIIFENVSFSFKDRSKIYFDLNVKFQINKIYGFKGDSGSGKSTFINLLTGLLKPSIGNIFVDGIDINENITGWQNNIAYVPQDLFLTDDTILNNVAFGRNEEDIDLDLAEKVINLVGLKEFISQLKDGIYTIVGEKGVKISGGQKQRIGLARALYKKPKILVLDEATNSLDHDTEKSILDSLTKLNDITIFLVSHNNAPFYICDEIFEIKDKQFFKISVS